MSLTPIDEQLRKLAWGSAEIFPESELRDKLAAGRGLRVKLGLDPTAEHVHIGWAVVLRKLRQFQDLGHTAVLIVGDFTARIGDPSGQKKTRPMLAAGQVDAYAERLLDQFRLILSPDRLEIRRNSEWLEPLGVSGLLRLASSVTVGQMLQRNDFAARYAEHQPITITEFLYPLLQAYDSVAVGADVELGGTDQHYSLVLGRDVQRAHDMPPQTVLTVPLLEGTDGVAKMSQSLGNYIAITEAPGEMFGKLMRVPDPLMVKYLTLATGLEPEEVTAVEEGLQTGSIRPVDVKRRLAEEVVRIYHGSKAADEARSRFDRIHREHAIPDDVAEASIPRDCMREEMVFIPKLLKAVGMSASTSEARRKIAEGGVRIDGTPVQDEELPAAQIRGRVVQVGRRRFVRLV